MNTRYIVVLTPADADDEPGFTVTVPDLPGCITEGDTLEESLERAREVVELFIESLQADGLPVPPPRASIDQAALDDGQLVTTVELPTRTAA